jgi:hypothetical protein
VPDPAEKAPLDKGPLDWQAALARAKQVASQSHLRVDPFASTRSAHPPGIEKVSGNAADESIASIKAVSGWAKDDWNQLAGTGLAISSIFAEGLEFPGYPFLSALAQRPEYRAMVEITATQMTRKWIQLRSTDSEDEEKAKKIADLEKELDRLQARDCFRRAAMLDGYFGRSHLYIDTGDTNSPEELKTSLGNGRDAMSKQKFKKNKKHIRKLKVVEPVWCYPTSYNASDPLSDNWYTPETWFVMGKEIHASRLLKFSMREVPDLLKPAYSFGGISLSQLAKPYVDNWIRTRQSVADIVHAFSVFVLSSNIAETLQPGGEQLFQRADLFNLMRDNRGLMLIDKDSELFQNVSAPLGSLDALQAQTQEHMCLPAEALITTTRGLIAIKDVTTNDRVLTRVGFAPIKWVGVTDTRESLVEIKAGGAVLRVTEEHPVWVESISEFVSARNVNRSHHLLALKTKNQGNMENLSHGEGVGGHVTPVISIIQKLGAIFIMSCGRRTRGLFRRAMTFITKTVMDTTIAGTILNFYRAKYTTRNTLESDSMCQSLMKNVKKYVKSAVINTKYRIVQILPFAPDIVPLPVSGVPGGFVVDGLRARIINNALSAVQTLPVNLATHDSVLADAVSVPVTLVNVIEVPKQPVYNIEVAEGWPQEFFADGLLVHNSTVCRVPLIFLTGITPSGLNASSEGEIRVFYDWIEACQEVLFRPNLTRIIHFAMLNLWGEVDETIVFNFAPLWSLDETALANKRKLDADADVHLLDAGVLSSLEIRKRIAGDRDSPYTSLDVEDVPELLVEEAEGLEPAGGRPNPLALKAAGISDPKEENHPGNTSEKDNAKEV